jgi:hypothetical protein
VRYHPCPVGVLTYTPESGWGTALGGQSRWGGVLLKGNGGAHKVPSGRTVPPVECKGIRGPDCEADRPSRGESRA